MRVFSNELEEGGWGGGGAGTIEMGGSGGRREEGGTSASRTLFLICTFGIGGMELNRIGERHVDVIGPDWQRNRIVR